MYQNADPVNFSDFRWRKNPCGFRVMDVKELQRKVFFREPKSQFFFFVDDSIAHRNFVFAVNSFFSFMRIFGYGRISDLDDHVVVDVSLRGSEVASVNTTSYTRVDSNATSNMFPIGDFRNATAHFLKLRYISLSLPLISRTIGREDWDTCDFTLRGHVGLELANQPSEQSSTFGGGGTRT
ncbi:hypothetical protein TcYC6_0073830 [Trypanosoma cruzi]|nr:hypothetical protein TcYC6_0073830 [Trypanosoma cruzi]